MTKTGFVVCNEKYVKIKDDMGYVNYMSKVQYKGLELKKALEEQQMMDQSVHIPPELILRSIPINLELLDLIRQKKIAAEEDNTRRNRDIDPDLEYTYADELNKIISDDI
jgi:hypothetical protein